MKKIHDKFASLCQVISPNSQDMFQICCADVYLVRFLVNFMVHVFCVFVDFTGFPRFTLYMKFPGPQPREISEALIKGKDV